MGNLEELTLLIGIEKLNCDDFVDGNHLDKDFMMHLSQLRKFRFSIHTYLFRSTEPVNLISNDDVQRSFRRSIFGPVGSYVEHPREDHYSSCHVYSLPFTFDVFMRLNRSFTAGIFNGVRTLCIVDWTLFDHDFCRKIADSFPQLERLCISNSTSQSETRKLNTNIGTLPVVSFMRLTYLHFGFSHMDYVEHLLSDCLTSLPCLRQLHVDYTTLSELTDNFTDDVARKNCARVRVLGVSECFVPPENFLLYFPSLDILKK